MYELYEKHLFYLSKNKKLRNLISSTNDRSKNYLNFSTNDYLNLSNNKQILATAIKYGQIYGVGATGSRLLSGGLDLYKEFERIIALDKVSEASLVFNSGFQANISTLSCLLEPKILGHTPIVFFDKLNHSSLYQAVFLSKAELIRYQHNDIDHLKSLLIKYQNDPRSKFIVSETVFGMDGDLAPIQELINLADHYNALLYLDEAHATGLFGIHGYGRSTDFNLNHISHVIMGTFSKAIGTSGGYIASHHTIRDFLINKATGFIYSTAPSPMLIGATLEAWKIVKTLDQERKFLQDLGNSLRTMLIDFGFNIGNSQTHIVPIILNEEKLCLKIKDLLYKENIMVSCIRPPTVPPGTSRLRIALTIKHQMQDLIRLVATLQRAI